MAKRKFNSNDYHFRPTSLAEAMTTVGLIKRPHLVREPKQSITATDKEGTAWKKERMIPVRRIKAA